MLASVASGARAGDLYRCTQDNGPNKFEIDVRACRKIDTHWIICRQADQTYEINLGANTYGVMYPFNSSDPLPVEIREIGHCTPRQ